MRVYPNEKDGGTLEIGTNGKGEVVINHPDIDPDKDGVGHMVFSLPVRRGDWPMFLTKKAELADKEIDTQ